MKQDNIIRQIDWFTIVLYLGLGIMGWLAICGAGNSYIENDWTEFFDQSTRTGKQALWMGVSFFVGLILMCIDKRTYKDWSGILYIALMALGVLTIFVARDIKGSHSWITIGGFSIQPAEFMKFGTTLMLASIISRYGFKMSDKKDFAKCVGTIMLPLLIIIMQKETGSALVYLSLFLVLYREGMTGMILLTALSAIVYFVVGIRNADVLVEGIDISLGHYAILLIIQCISILMVKFWCKHDRTFLVLLIVNIVCSVAAYWTAIYLIKFNVLYAEYLLIAFNIIYLALRARIAKEIKNLWVILFIIGSIAFYGSCDFVMNKVLGEHQRVRIEVLLGLKEDLSGAGYNVHQSLVAIGSGGFGGKGFLNGTQTKLKYVPEQDTDFIFCTIGEEQGFLGTTFVIIVFAIFIIRLMMLAERQKDRFGRVYGYAVASIFFFHLTINVGMVIGIMPVIGIPLPFFSYGGSSFLGFSILLFSFLRIDADRNIKP